MTRLFCVMAVVVLGLMAVSAWAAVPYPPNCTVTWRSPTPSSDDSTKILCPQADAEYLDVTVRDQFNTPMGSQTVTVTFTSPLIIIKTPPLTGVTAVGTGYVRIPIRAGMNWAGPVNIITKAHVVVQSIEIYDPDFNFISPDYNGSLKVDAQDFVLFADDWLRIMKDCHSNFLRTVGTATENRTDAQDYSIFASHWLHQ